MKDKVVKVEWVDSRFFDGWQPEEAASRMSHSVVRTIGYIVYEDKASLVVALNKSGRNSISDCIAIPKKCILRKKFSPDI